MRSLERSCNFPAERSARSRRKRKPKTSLLNWSGGGSPGSAASHARMASAHSVLKSGKCILAEYTTFKGDAALEFLHQALAGEDVDAALSTLDEAQIQLSMEFNKPERITKTGRVPPASQKTVHLPPVPPAHQSVVKKTGTAPEQIRPPPRKRRQPLWHIHRKARRVPLQPRKMPSKGPPGPNKGGSRSG